MKRTFRSPVKLFAYNALIVPCGFVALLFILGCGSVRPPATNHKVLVLGIDGLDPRILQDFIAQGKLPHFKRLQEQGGFKPLTTSMPPQSPVAWSNFITGMDPGGHGIFDFIHRDPNTLLPYLSTSQMTPSQKSIEIGDWILPLSSGKAELLRKGKAFWEYLNEYEIPTTIIKVPANFPPVETRGHAISGMGTPDLLGTYGIFTYFTDDPAATDKTVSGGRVVKVIKEENTIHARLPGPHNPFKKGNPDTGVNFTVWVDTVNPVGKIALQDTELLLNAGEWSGWIPVEFEMMPLVQNVTGIVRFFLKEVHPHFRLYVSPININPADPALPISSPNDYAAEVCEEVGFFHTLGIPEDTKALQAGILDDREYWQQAEAVLTEEMKIFDYALAGFDAGLLFYYFSSVDQNYHMFWRAADNKHVLYSDTLHQQFGELLARLYVKMDEVVGRALEKTEGGNTTLLVMSDHGFAPFYRAFHLNTWLKNEGYLVLKDESRQGRDELLQNIDWRKTKAYAMGLNGLYLNIRDREPFGIVQQGKEAEELLEELSRKLLAFKDPQNNQPVFAKIYRATEIYHGPYVQQAPDLLTGFHRGYRVSWETALGGVPKEVMVDNKDKWSGDHCMAAELVPGVVMSNKPILVESPALYDLAPTILQEFGLEKGEQMIGNSIFTAATAGLNN